MTTPFNRDAFRDEMRSRLLARDANANISDAAIAPAVEAAAILYETIVSAFTDMADLVATTPIELDKLVGVAMVSNTNPIDVPGGCMTSDDEPEPSWRT